MATGQEAAKRALTIGRATKTPKVVRGATAALPKQSTGGAKAADVTRRVKQAGNSVSPPTTVQGQRAQARGKSKAGKAGTAEAVVTPVHGGSSGAKHPWA